MVNELYLENRSQNKSWGGGILATAEVTCGVPQGPVLGLLMFLLYINDLHNVSSLLLPTPLAEDPNLLLTGNSIREYKMCTYITLDHHYRDPFRNKMKEHPIITVGCPALIGASAPI